MFNLQLRTTCNFPFAICNSQQLSTYNFDFNLQLSTYNSQPLTTYNNFQLTTYNLQQLTTFTLQLSFQSCQEWQSVFMRTECESSSQKKQLPPPPLMGTECESSSPQKKGQPPPRLHVPKHLVEAVNHARPLCIFHQMPKGCKKGAKCPQRHTGASNNDVSLPYMSFSRDKDGQVKCTLRPPLNESWDYIFKEKCVPRRVLKGSINISSGKEDLRMYQLGYMSVPSPKAKEAMSQGGIQRWTWRKNEWKYTWQGATGRVNLECFFIHGTTVENAIQAILDGGLKPTTFEGVYFSELPSMDEEDIIVHGTKMNVCIEIATVLPLPRPHERCD